MEWRVLFGFVAALIYVTPWIVSLCRHVRRSWILLLATILFGWTLIGWVACLIWAIYARTVVDQAYLRAETGWQPKSPSSLFRHDKRCGELPPKGGGFADNP